MSSYLKKIIRHTQRWKQKQKPTQFEDTEQASEPDTNMAGILEIADCERVYDRQILNIKGMTKMCVHSFTKVSHSQRRAVQCDGSLQFTR